MTKLIRRLLALALVAALPTLAHAQNLETLNGPIPSSAPSGSTLQGFQFNCTTTTPASGTCAPLVIMSNANPNGQASANNSAPAVLPATQITTDPCSLGGGVGGPVTKQNFAFTTTAASIQIAPPSGSPPEQVYICSIDINTTAADSISLIGGLSALCTTGTPVAIAGSLTPANGMAFPALYTWSRGTGGATIYRTTTEGHGVCVVQSGTTELSISGTFVEQ
jgi:hypothetical protein